MIAEYNLNFCQYLILYAYALRIINPANGREKFLFDASLKMELVTTRKFKRVNKRIRRRDDDDDSEGSNSANNSAKIDNGLHQGPHQCIDGG